MKLPLRYERCEQCGKTWNVSTLHGHMQGYTFAPFARKVGKGLRLGSAGKRKRKPECRKFRLLPHTLIFRHDNARAAREFLSWHKNHF